MPPLSLSLGVAQLNVVPPSLPYSGRRRFVRGSREELEVSSPHPSMSVVRKPTLGSVLSPLKSYRHNRTEPRGSRSRLRRFVALLALSLTKYPSPSYDS